MPSARNSPCACCTMPLVRGPTAIRRPRRSENERIGDCARTMKNSGPAFIGAAMGECDRPRERRLAFLGGAVRVRAHEADLDLARVRGVGFSRAGGLGFQALDRRQGPPPFEQRLERAALTVEGAVALGSADADGHERKPGQFGVIAAANIACRSRAWGVKPRRKPKSVSTYSPLP